MNITKKSMKVARNYNVWDIAIFELYLLAVSFLLAILFPVLLEANVRAYVVIAVVLTTYTIHSLWKKEGNFYKDAVFKDWSKKIFKKQTMTDLAIFKLTVLSVGLLLVKVFPVLLTVHLAWYVGVFGFGLGHFFTKLCSTK